MSTGDGPDDFDDGIRRLVDDAGAGDAPREPSFAERQRALRSADLARRLRDQAELDRLVQERDRRVERRATRRARRARWLGPVVLIVLVGGLVYLSQGHGRELVAAPHELRARPADFPPLDDAVSDAPLGTPPPLGTHTGPYHFAAKQSDGAPVTWDPCRPVRFVINPAGQPVSGEQLIRDAIQRTSQATGLVFEDAGSTAEAWSKDRKAYQPERYGTRWAPVLISWSTAAVVPGLGTDRTGGDQGGDVAGLGGGIRVSLGDGEPAYVSGQVVLDIDDLSPALDQPGGPDQVRSVIQHELGHVVGLGHVPDSSQLMWDRNNGNVTDWGPGDLAGLHALGSGSCHPDL